jgi:peptide/nickel transport system permease protein
MDLIAARLPNSFKLAGAAFTASIVIAVVLGTIAAVWRNTPWDLIVRITGVLGLAVPSFWIGILLIDLFAVDLGWLPVAGTGGPKHFIMPAIVIGSTAVAGMMRLLRSQLIEVLNSDYIRTARAKGLAGPAVVMGHALRNALIPVLTVAGVFFAGLLGGSVVAESIFAWPGIGQLAYQAVTARDFPVMQAVVLITGAIIVGMNLLVDLLYGVIDPRIRMARGGR